MTRTIRARFDGEVFRPEQPIDLRVNTSYVITIEGEAPDRQDSTAADTYPLTAIGRLAIDMGVDDLSTRHDWYAHGRIADGTP